MILGIETLVENLGVSIEGFFVIFWLLAGFLIYAIDFKLGAVLHFLGFGTIFIWMYNWSLTNSDITWSTSLTLTFVFLIIMAFALYPSSNSTVNRGFN